MALVGGHLQAWFSLTGFPWNLPAVLYIFSSQAHLLQIGFSHLLQGHFIISTTAQLNFKTWIKLWPSLFLRQFLMTLIRKSFFTMVRKLWILSTSPSPFNSYIKNFPPTNFFVGLWWSPAFPVFVCNLCNIQNGKSHSKMMSDIGKESSRIILNQRTQSGGLAHQELQTKDETFLLYGCYQHSQTHSKDLNSIAKSGKEVVSTLSHQSSTLISGFLILLF